jgi:hypothetical protein
VDVFFLLICEIFQLTFPQVHFRIHLCIFKLLYAFAKFFHNFSSIVIRLDLLLRSRNSESTKNEFFVTFSSYDVRVVCDLFFVLCAHLEQQQRRTTICSEEEEADRKLSMIT